MALALVASPAAAEPLFDSFQKLCVAVDSDPRASLAAADADGWMPMPEALLAGAGRGGITFEGGRIKSSAGSMQMLFHGSDVRTLAGDAVKLQICAVGEMPGDSSAVKQAVARWVAVPPEPRFTKGEGDIGYVFRVRDGAHVHVAKPSPKEARQLMKEGDVKMVFVRANKQMVLVGYGRPGL